MMALAPANPGSSLYDDPDLYDSLLPVSDEQRTFYVELARRSGGPVLELACGSGQLLVPVAATGLPSVGLDSSTQMLDGARRRASAAGADIELIHGDMRDFDAGRLFSLIFVARNSLLHLAEPYELAGLFRAVRRHLGPGGTFAFDIFNPSIAALARPAGERFQVMRLPSTPYGELTVDATSDYDPASQVNRVTWFISTATQPDAWIAPLHLRSIFPQELLSLLAANDFRLISRDGDYVGSRFTGSSARQVCRSRPG
jgi:SAM-dependent methyltransferase